MPSTRFSALVGLATLLVSSANFAIATPAEKRSTVSIRAIFDGSQVSGQTFDYVIAGGGLAGSVLASRLSEDSSKTVLLVEAGYNQESNDIVFNTGNYQKAFDTELDWQYKTVPQAKGDVQTMRAGRMLGGSTGINGMAWSKPNSFQIDALETVGNSGLNWASLQPYMLKAESGSAPTNGLTWRPSCHGTSGPISVQFDNGVSPAQLEKDFNKTVTSTLGLPYAFDLTCGNPSGAAPIANTRNGGKRINAYTGYLANKSRSNLLVLAGAQVGKVFLSSDSTPRATGVELQDENGVTYTVNAGKEVIVATGSLKTPAILQHSGIGPTKVLQAAGITQRVNLPVGQNLIDQTTTTTNWQFKNARGGGQPILWPRFQDIVTGSDATTLRSLLQNNLTAFAQDSVNAGAASSVSALTTVLQIQADWILNKGVAFSELFDYSFGTTLGYDSWYLLPFGRGYVSVKDTNAYTGAVDINPRYFTNAFDRLAQAATVKFSRTVSSSAPLNGDIVSESTPGTGAVPTGSTLEKFAQWAETHYRSNWHPIGTVSMMSKDLGGSVDSRHRVYGVNGLRVVDASVLPFQLSSHLMSVLYGISERAAELIIADNGGNNSPVGSSHQLHPASFGGKCLDVKDGTFANGQPVQLWDCNGKAQQTWTVTPGLSTKIQATGTNFCIDFGTSPTSGTKLKIWMCFDGLAAQSFSFNNGGQISNQGQCIDLTDGSSTNGNIVQTWACSSGNTNQNWTI